MIGPGEKVLIAVSGGADSVALLHCLHRLARKTGWTLAAAHLNHGIRGPESDQDEQFVLDACVALQVPCHAGRIEVAARARSERANLEEAGRKLRYDFLRRTAREIGAGRIATGHSRDDQAETLLMRLLRGSGLEGLASIRPVLDGLIVRPLLEQSRAAIVEYLHRAGRPHREDTSNRNLKYLRNRIRHELIPRLEAEFNPRVAENLARLAALARESDEFLQDESRRAYLSLRSCGPQSITLPVEILLSFPPIIQSMAVRHAIRDCRGSLRKVTVRHIEEVLSLCRPGNSGRQVVLPGGGMALRQFDSLMFRSDPLPPAGDFCHTLPIPGSCRVPEASMVFRASVCEKPASPPATQHRLRVCLDAARVPAELSVRPRRPGDRYGGPGRRKVKEVIAAARIPWSQRAGLPMVAAGEAVIWIPGLKPAKNYAAGPDAGRWVVVEAERLGDGDGG